MSKDNDPKITGGWAFLNTPDPSPSSSKNKAATGPKSGFAPAAQLPAAPRFGPWLKRNRGIALGGSVAALLLGVGAWFAFIREPGPKPDPVAIQGEWRITKLGGTPGQDDGQMTVRVQGDRWTYVVNGKDATTWRMELKPDADPRAIDLTLLERNGEPIQVKGPVPKQLGVYEVDRKTLRVALAPEFNGRPKGFDDPDAPALLLNKAK